MSLDYYDDSLDSDTNMPHYARITFYGQQTYIMTKERIVIGRNSAAGVVDIDVGSVSFVSRRHLELTFSYQRLKLKCLGKNGIFINNIFEPHSCIPYELPAKCILRFPSTDIQFCVEQLIGLKTKKAVNKSKNFIRFFHDNDESPDHKRIKLQSRNDSDISDNNESFHGFREVIENFSDNEVEDYMPQDDVRKLSVSDCDGLMNEGCEDNGVLMENIGGHGLDNNVSISTINTIDDLKQSDIHGSGITNSGGRPVTKVVLGNFRYAGEQPYVQNGRIAVLEQDDLTIEHGSDTQKPPYSYAQLIVQAVSTARDRQLTLNGIYNYISKNYPYFKAHDKGWQNSVRHNLSLNRYFIKVPRGQDEPGKGSFWRVDPVYENKLIAQAFRKRRLRNSNSGMATESTLMSQVLNVEPNNQESNSKVFGVNKSSQIINRTSNFGGVLTLKRACDINQNGGTTYMLSNSHGLSNHDAPKYILTSRNGSHPVETLTTASVQNSSITPIFKYQGAKSMIVESGKTSTNNSIQQSSSNSGCTLISLGGRLFSTTSIKSVQSQRSQRSISGSNSTFDNITNNDSDNIVTSKGSYYIISPNNKNRKSHSDNQISNSQHSPIAISGSNRRIISIQSQSPGIRKIDLSNGNNSDSQIKNPVILKKVKLSSNNFVTVKSCPGELKGGKGKVVMSMSVVDDEHESGVDSVDGRNDSDRNVKMPEPQYQEDNDFDGDVKEEDHEDHEHHQFISDDTPELDTSCDMDHFLMPHSDPSVSGMGLRGTSESGSSPALMYKLDPDSSKHADDEDVEDHDETEGNIHDNIDIRVNDVTHVWNNVKDSGSMDM